MITKCIVAGILAALPCIAIWACWESYKVLKKESER